MSLKHAFALVAATLVLALAAGGLSLPAVADATSFTGGPEFHLRPKTASTGKAASATEREKAARTPLVVLDPGHGGPEVGAAWNGVVEKDSNLDMAFRVEALLLAQGFNVVLTRRMDARVEPDPSLPSVGGSATRGDLQARLDIANRGGAAVWVSLHHNGSSERSQNGVEVWYDPNRAFAEENLRLAGLLLNDVVQELYAYGYPALDRGLKDDTCFRYRNGRCFQLYVLGGRADGRGAGMPGALIESLFISNFDDNVVLHDPAGRDAIARGIARAIAEFLGGSTPATQ